MKFKALIALVTEDRTEKVIEVARREGATGCTVITSARGEGLVPPKTFFGMELEAQRDVVLFIVEAHLSREILEAIAREARFDEDVGSGIAFEFDVEDAVGLGTQVPVIKREIEDEI
ncbi:MAG TPA: P-II family nitrogen regulator [Gaiellaceae bacterium]|nr:P-II family nitrogen regulator [Gaiellaceae bacterium]